MFHPHSLQVNGEIPDMESSTKLFNEVKGIYAAKAAADRAALGAILHQLVADAGALEGIASDVRKGLAYSEPEVADLCKNCGFLALLKTSSLTSEVRAMQRRLSGICHLLH